MPTLHERISAILNRHSTKLCQEWLVHSPITHSAGIVQDINLANRHFRLTLGTLPISTTDARESLYATHDYEEWLDDFETFVVPLLVQFNSATHHHR